jgi:FtsP/CotA-like multicopper oxidase with cupredoxin domain
VRAFSRRQFLASASAAGIVGAAASSMSSVVRPAIAAALEPTLLRVTSRTIAVNGKPAKVLGLLQADGRSGIVVPAGRFHVRLENEIDAPTLIHWHGLLPPYGQDGVPDLPQPLLPPGRSYDYDFPLATPGTHWMHAHTLQEQQLLAAPLIVTDPAEDAADEQPVVVLFHDFSFKTPEELLAGLVGGSGMSGMAGMSDTGGHAGHGGMSSMGDMSGMMNQDMSGMDSGMAGGMAMDINDIDYDAYLANDRALDDPEVFRVDPGGIVRLRLINGATATAFWIDLGTLGGEAIAVDGNPIAPVAGQRFPLAMGQRIDIRIRLPQGQGAWPILALREGAVERTGFVLATKDGAVERIAATAAQAAPVLDLVLESGLRAARPFADTPAHRPEAVVIGGDMASYVWTLDGRVWGQHRSIAVKAGERVEIALRNQSMMGHPIHLHGHHFQVVAIDGKRLSGAVRDTVWLPPMREVTIAFDAGNPGTWAFHCHHLYHMATGMMTVVDYTA